MIQPHPLSGSELKPRNWLNDCLLAFALGYGVWIPCELILDSRWVEARDDASPSAKGLDRPYRADPRRDGGQ